MDAGVPGVAAPRQRQSVDDSLNASFRTQPGVADSAGTPTHPADLPASAGSFTRDTRRVSIDGLTVGFDASPPPDAIASNASDNHLLDTVLRETSDVAPSPPGGSPISSTAGSITNLNHSRRLKRARQQSAASGSPTDAEPDPFAEAGFNAATSFTKRHRLTVDASVNGYADADADADGGDDADGAGSPAHDPLATAHLAMCDAANGGGGLNTAGGLLGVGSPSGPPSARQRRSSSNTLLLHAFPKTPPPLPQEAAPGVETAATGETGTTRNGMEPGPSRTGSQLLVMPVGEHLSVSSVSAHASNESGSPVWRSRQQSGADSQGRGGPRRMIPHRSSNAEPAEKGDGEGREGASPGFARKGSRSGAPQQRKHMSPNNSASSLLSPPALLLQPHQRGAAGAARATASPPSRVSPSPLSRGDDADGGDLGRDDSSVAAPPGVVSPADQVADLAEQALAAVREAEQKKLIIPPPLQMDGMKRNEGGGRRSLQHTPNSEHLEGIQVSASSDTRRQRMSAIADDLMKPAPDSLGTSDEEHDTMTDDTQQSEPVPRVSSSIQIRDLIVDAVVPPKELLDEFLTSLKDIDVELYEHNESATKSHRSFQEHEPDDAQDTAVLINVDSNGGVLSPLTPGTTQTGTDWESDTLNATTTTNTNGVSSPTLPRPDTARQGGAASLLVGADADKPAATLEPQTSMFCGVEPDSYSNQQRRAQQQALFAHTAGLGERIIRDSVGFVLDRAFLLLVSVDEGSPADDAAGNRFLGRQVREVEGMPVSMFLRLAHLLADELRKALCDESPMPSAATGNAGDSDEGAAANGTTPQVKAPPTRKIKFRFAKVAKNGHSLSISLPNQVRSPDSATLFDTSHKHGSYSDCDSDEHASCLQAQHDTHPFLCLCTEYLCRIVVASMFEAASLISVAMVVTFVLLAPFMVWIAEGDWGTASDNLTEVMNAVSEDGWSADSVLEELFANRSVEVASIAGDFYDRWILGSGDDGATIVTITMSTRRNFVSMEWTALMLSQVAVTLALSGYEQWRWIIGLKTIVFVVFLVWIHAYAVYGIASYWLQLAVVCVTVALMDAVYLYACGWKHSFMLVVAVVVPFVYSALIAVLLLQQYLNPETGATERALILGVAFPLIRALSNSVINSFARLLIISDHPGLFVAATLPTMAINAMYLHLMAYKAEPWVGFACYAAASFIHFLDGLYTIPRARASDLLVHRLLSRCCVDRIAEIPFATKGLFEFPCRHGLYDETAAHSGAGGAGGKYQVDDWTVKVSRMDTHGQRSDGGASQGAVLSPTRSSGTMGGVTGGPTAFDASVSSMAGALQLKNRQMSQRTTTSTQPGGGGGGGGAVSGGAAALGTPGVADLDHHGDARHHGVFDPNDPAADAAIQLFLDQVTSEYFCGRMLDFTATLSIGMYIVCCGGNAQYFFNFYPTPYPSGPNMEHTGALIGFQLSIHLLDTFLTQLYQMVPVNMPSYFRLSPLEFVLRLGHRPRSILLMATTTLFLAVMVLTSSKMDQMLAPACSSLKGSTHLTCLAAAAEWDPPANTTDVTAYVYPELNATHCCRSRSGAYFGGVFVYYLP